MLLAEERLLKFNDKPRFPYFVTHSVDGMPLCSGGSRTADFFFNLEYTVHVYEMTVVVTILGSIVWICNLQLV